jgi:hypothetical protein
MRKAVFLIGVFCLILLLDSVGGLGRHEHETRVQALCEEGFVLHGRGRWGDALKHFAATVTAHSVWDAIDCVYGAGLSLNVLGETEVLYAPILRDHHSGHSRNPISVSMTKTRRIRMRKDCHPRGACCRVSHHFGRGCVPKP